MMAPGAARAVRIMHVALVSGSSIAGATFAVLRRALHMSFGISPDIGRWVGAAAFGVLAVAVLFLGPRIPQRRSDQGSDEYWSAYEIPGAALILWSVVEGAGMIGWLGYLLTGSTTPALAGLLSIFALILFRPARVEGHG